MNENSKIYVAGHNGLAGSAIYRRLKSLGYNNILVREHKELDLENQHDVLTFFEKNKPDYVFIAAAKVGGIHANNSYKAEFIYNNLMIQCNVINAAYKYHVKRLVFLGSTCIYPRLCPQPMNENDLLSGSLEPTNESYAIAKIAGVKMIEAYNKQYGTNYLALMPTNMYGFHDNFNLENGHVLPALLRRFHEAKINNIKEIILWGTGQAKREFLFSDDMADASIYLINRPENPGLINIGTGDELSIKELALLISKIVSYDGQINFDTSKPDGTPRKLSDVTKLEKLGWKAKTNLEKGLELTYKWMLENPNYKK